MRKIIRHIVIIASLVCLPVFMSNIFADQPPDPGGGPGGGDDPVGGGSSIGGSMITMLVLGFAYGTRKFISIRKKLLE